MMRASMSRPYCGSTPSGCAQLMPPQPPLGASSAGSIRFWWNSSGSSPKTHSIGLASTAISTRQMTTMPPATATLSRLNRVQAICVSERPSIWLFLAPASTASGCAPASAPVVSIGAVTMT